MQHNQASDQGLHCLLTGFSIKNRIKATKQTRTTGPRADCVSAKANLSLYCIIQSSRSVGVVDDNFSYFSSKPYAVTPHLNRLNETVQLRGHNLCFYAELKKNYP